MKLTVKNLGVVSHAEVDLSKDLLIFTGENNTGKTYLAYTVHAIFDPDTSGSDQYTSRNLEFDRNGKYSVDALEILSDSQKQITLLNNYLEERVNQNLNKYFSVENGFFSNTQIFLEKQEYDFVQEKILNTSLDMNIMNISAKKMKGDRFINLTVTGDKIEWSLQDTIEESIRSVGLRTLLNRTIIFPSVREGINLFNKELSVIKNKTFDALLSRNEAQELSNFLASRFNKYPKAIRNSLSMAQNLDAQRTQTSEFAHLADELENLFLQGKISVNTEGDVLFKPFNSERSLDIHMTSSTIKSLSLLTVYLRHTAQKNDFIIIDEPELNLHPDNQRKIARFIGRLINEGFKVLISTHSDYIVRELNNLIMLGSGLKHKPDETKELLENYHYKTNELLSKDRLGVYLFRVGQPVAEIPIAESGFNVATIDEEARKLNQSSQDIYFTLFDQ